MVLVVRCLLCAFLLRCFLFALKKFLKQSFPVVQSHLVEYGDTTSKMRQILATRRCRCDTCTSFYRPHPKDGEVDVFSLSTPGGGPWGTPLSWDVTWMGKPQDRVPSHPGMGYPPPGQDNRRSTFQKARSMSLAFTHEDFLVKLVGLLVTSDLGSGADSPLVQHLPAFWWQYGSRAFLTHVLAHISRRICGTCTSKDEQGTSGLVFKIPLYIVTLKVG